MTQKDTSGQSSPLTGRQKQVAQLLASGKTQNQAADECGVARITVIRWCRLQAMQDAIREAEDELADHQLRMLYKLIGKAILTLKKQMDSPKGNVAVQSASKVLDLVLDIGKISRLEAELAKIEEQCLTSREGSMLITPLCREVDSL